MNLFPYNEINLPSATQISLCKLLRCFPVESFTFNSLLPRSINHFREGGEEGERGREREREREREKIYKPFFPLLFIALNLYLNHFLSAEAIETS
jgi:hypothetical protein